MRSHVKRRRQPRLQMLTIGSGVICFCAPGGLLPSSAFVSSHPPSQSSATQRTPFIGHLSSSDLLLTRSAGFPLHAFGPIFRRRKSLPNNRGDMPIDTDQLPVYGTDSPIDGDGDADEEVASAATEICFDPQSFERGLDPCIPDPNAEDDSCLPPQNIREYEAALAEVKAREDFGSEEEDDDEICVLVYDKPAIPRYELPVLDPRKDIDEKEGEMDDAEDLSALAMDGEEVDDEGTFGDVVAQGDDVTSDDDDEEEEDEDEDIRPLCGRGIVIIDNFSPYHGNYLSQMAREAYGAGVVSALSNYVTGYLYQEKGMKEHLTSRLPDMDSMEDVERWANAMPFEIVGIICESDSGLDDAERLGEALGLYPDRHDGFNPARRDKFLMNEACERAGLRVVRQKMCSSLEEALEFARELGVGEEEGGETVIVEDTQEGMEAMPMANGHIDGEEEEIRDEEIETTTPIAKGEDITDEIEEVEAVDETLADSTEGIQSEILVDEEDEAEIEESDNFDDEEEEHTMPSNTGMLGLATNDHSGDSPCRYCVVKPSRGVASDDVHLCPDLESVQDAFNRIKGSTVFGSMHGEKHDSVLVQEFATGTEYAIDIVSKAGHHKVAALWRYDKRPANGAAFVYHATELVDADTEVGRAVCEYAMTSLDALNVHWGISHDEVIVDEDGPRLVEVNLRQHNTDFAPLTSACIGYNALDMLLAAYLGDAEEFPPNTEHKRLVWDDLPDLPVTRAYGAIIHLVSHTEGTLAGINVPALEEIEEMSSVLAMELYPQFTTIGEHIEKTIDIRTDSGWLHMMNDDPDQFKSDYDRVVDLMPHMFAVEEEGDDDAVDDEGIVDEPVSEEDCTIAEEIV